MTQVDSVVQFYSFLYDQPRGRYRILFSDNITDRMLGSLTLFEHMLKRLKLKRGEVSADGAVSVDLTSCTGMCDQGPALLVNNRPVTRVTARRVDEICDLVRAAFHLPSGRPIFSASRTTSAAPTPCSVRDTSRGRVCGRRSRSAGRACSTR